MGSSEVWFWFGFGLQVFGLLVAAAGLAQTKLFLPHGETTSVVERQIRTARERLRRRKDGEFHTVGASLTLRANVEATAELHKGMTGDYERDYPEIDDRLNSLNSRIQKVDQQQREHSDQTGQELAQIQQSLGRLDNDSRTRDTTVATDGLKWEAFGVFLTLQMLGPR